VISCGWQFFIGAWWIGMVNEVLPCPFSCFDEVHCLRAMGLDPPSNSPETPLPSHLKRHIARGQHVRMGSQINFDCPSPILRCASLPAGNGSDEPLGEAAAIVQSIAQPDV
jgi:hypothetical protein